MVKRKMTKGEHRKSFNFNTKYLSEEFGWLQIHRPGQCKTKIQYHKTCEKVSKNHDMITLIPQT